MVMTCAWPLDRRVKPGDDVEKILRAVPPRESAPSSPQGERRTELVAGEERT
jgi:hypothetical protein